MMHSLKRLGRGWWIELGTKGYCKFPTPPPLQVNFL